MFKKIAGIVVLVAVAGVLTFGAINRTLAHNENATSLTRNLNSESTGHAIGAGRLSDQEEIQYGNGNGGGRNIVENENLPIETGIQDHETLLETLPLGDLDQQEIDALFFMVEEEKLARDVYSYLYQQWNLAIFNNITGSEQHHMDSIKDLLVRYDLADPSSAQAGVFDNADLQALYNQLIAQGSQSLEAALQVGGAIEEIDILDLQERLAQTDQDDIQLVFESLLNGSSNHLNAFSSNYARQSGETYQPQYMSLEAYQSLIGSSSGG